MCYDMRAQEEDMNDAWARAVEHSITTRFRKTIWRNFVSAMKQYRLTQPGDVIAVCVSGGKDSLLLAKCMQLLEQYSDIPFETKFLCMDPGYSPENRQMILETAAKLGIELTMFDTDILSIAEGTSSPCHVCAAMRRGYLYKEARKLGCNKIALGHHFDDVCETVLLSMFYGGEFKTMMPRLSSDNYEGMQLIRPLYLVREKYILLWQAAHQIPALTCACAVTRREEGGKRKEIKNLLKELATTNPRIMNNIFSSIQNINLDTVLSYRPSKGEEPCSVLDAE